MLWGCVFRTHFLWVPVWLFPCLTQGCLNVASLPALWKQLHPSFLPTPLTLLEFCSCITWHYAFKKFFFSLMWTILKVFIEFLTILLLFFFYSQNSFYFLFLFLRIVFPLVVIFFNFHFHFILFYNTVLVWPIQCLVCIQVRK